MLPVAKELVYRGEALEWRERIVAVNGTGICVFYKPDPLVPGNGRCQFYSLRPPICRLFAFATRKNKYGKPELVACTCQKKAIPFAVAAAQEAISRGLPAPSFIDFSLRIAALEPSLGSRQMPINQALGLALERAGLMIQLRRANTPSGCGFSAKQIPFTR
jgi:Fe-S-cluster containining protein